MIHEVASDLPKLGARDYVQGGSILNAILRLADEVIGPRWLEGTTIASFKLQRESTGNGRFRLADEPLDDQDGAHASFVAQRPGSRLHVCYYDEGRPTRREDYDEESYYRAVTVGGDLCGEFVFPGGRPREHFVRAMVGANKRVHEKAVGFGAPLKRIQFLYLKGLDGVALQHADAEYAVRIDNVSVQERDREVWTINRMAVTAPHVRTEFRICYRAVREVA